MYETMCALGGRPKEEGGHTRVDITVDKEIKRKLEKFKRQGGNVSKFVENEIRPTLKELDPGEQSIHVYRIEAYLSNEIIEAAAKGDYETVKTLGSLATAIDDYRRLAHIPPLHLPKTINGNYISNADDKRLDAMSKIGLTPEFLEGYAEVSWLASQYPMFEPLKQLYEERLKVLRTLGLLPDKTV